MWFQAQNWVSPKGSPWCPTATVSLTFPLWPLSSSLMTLWFVGIQLVWQQTNQVQEEYRQVSGRSQPLRCKDSRDSRTRSGRSCAEQPDQFAHHAKFWCVLGAHSLLSPGSLRPQSPVPQVRKQEPYWGHGGFIKEELCKNAGLLLGWGTTEWPEPVETYCYSEFTRYW